MSICKIKYTLLALLALSLTSLYGQHYHSCPLDHHLAGNSYEHPLNARYLSSYDVHWYYLDIQVSNLNTNIQGSGTMGITALEAMDTIVLELNGNLVISDVSVNDVLQANFRHLGDTIYIPHLLAQGEKANVKVTYFGSAEKEDSFFSGYTTAYDQTNQQWVTYTLSEPLNASQWFPVKQVLPDKADSVWMDITTSKDLMAGSNGLLVEVEEASETMHTFKWRSYYPIAYYLISIAVADYMDYSFKAPLSNEMDSVLVQNFIYNDPEYLDQWKERIDETGDMITLFSKKVEDYPFAAEKYGHSVAPMGGGMEHQTMTTLSNFGFNLVAHELAHQWFGDNLTCANWQDIWVNEGFASYFEYIALQHLRTQKDADNWMVSAMDRAFSETGSVYVPAEEAEDVYRVFDYGLTYKKGATLLHMIRHEINNDELFFEVLTQFSQQYSDSVATGDDFRLVLEDVSGIDFSCFFDQWYYGKGFPTFNISWQRRNDSLIVSSEQLTSSSETPLFKMTFDLMVETDLGEEQFRFYQDSNYNEFRVPLNGAVQRVVFDPQRKLLAKGNVRREFPNGLAYQLLNNPFSNAFTISLPEPSGTSTYALYDLSGVKLHEDGLLDMNTTIDMTGFPDRTYVLVISTNQGVFQEKLVKVSN